MVKARIFELHRREDPTGVSGTGVVATGIEWPDGRVAMRWRAWRGVPASIVVFDSVGDLLRIHGHSGATEVVWLSR